MPLGFTHYVYFFVSFTLSLCSNRELMSYINPGCNNCNFTVVYTSAVGAEDTIHYIWDFSRLPSFLLTVTPRNGNVLFDWTKFNNGEQAISLTDSSMYTCALLIDKLIEYDDVNNNGLLDEKEPRLKYNMKNFVWSRTGNNEKDENGLFVSMGMLGANYTDVNKTLTGTINIQLSAFGARDHDWNFPKLLHSQNSSQVKLTLNNLSTGSNFNDSRFAVSLIIASSDDTGSTSTIHSRQSLDDENTPGVFKVVEILTPRHVDNTSFIGGYLEWRPIVYTTKEASISNSTDTITYDLSYATDNYNNTLFYSYFGDSIERQLIQATLVSFGAKDDGFYKKTNFTSWTFLFGFGGPEKEKFSMLVILVISIGLGLPAVLLVTGGLYMCVKVCRRNKTELSVQ